MKLFSLCLMAATLNFTTAIYYILTDEVSPHIYKQVIHEI